MAHYTLTRALHFFGMILWLGGTIAAALVASYAADANVNASAGARRMVRTIANGAAACNGGPGSCRSRQRRCGSLAEKAA